MNVRAPLPSLKHFKYERDGQFARLEDLQTNGVARTDLIRLDGSLYLNGKLLTVSGSDWSTWGIPFIN